MESRRLVHPFVRKRVTGQEPVTIVALLSRARDTHRSQSGRRSRRVLMELSPPEGDAARSSRRADAGLDGSRLPLSFRVCRVASRRAASFGLSSLRRPLDVLRLRQLMSMASRSRRVHLGPVRPLSGCGRPTACERTAPRARCSYLESPEPSPRPGGEHLVPIRRL